MLESGTHAELLRKGESYTRLVEAQRLRDGGGPVDSKTKADVNFGGKVLDNKDTNLTLANDVHQVNFKSPSNLEKDHSLRYIVRRIAPLCRDQKYNYALAALFASSKLLGHSCSKIYQPF